MRKIPVYHVGPFGCGGICFYTTSVLYCLNTEVIQESVVLLNGSPPTPGDIVRCGTCGSQINTGYDDLSYQDAGRRNHA